MSVLKSFNVGDIVRLNSGGPELTVSSINGPQITAIWIQEPNGYGQLSLSPVCFYLVRRAGESCKPDGHHIDADDVRVNPPKNKA